SGELQDVDDPTSLVKKDATWLRGYVVYDRTNGRYRYESKGVVRWLDGPVARVGVENAFSFDGSAYRCYERQKNAPEVPGPGDDPGRGSIRSSGGCSYVKAGNPLGATDMGGVGAFPPFFSIGGANRCITRPLSEVLRYVADQFGESAVEITDKGNDTWTILLKIDKPLATDPGEQVRIDYDIKRGGIITAAETSGLSKERKRVPWMRLVYDYERTEDGFWVPRRVAQVALLMKVVHLSKFRDIKINPPVTDATFRIEFPPGCLVDDEIAQRSYYVGEDPANQQVAIERFMERFGLTQRHPVGESDTRWRTVLIVGNVLLFAGVLAFLAFRKWRASRRAIGLLLCASAVTSSVSAAPSPPSGGDMVSHAPGERIWVSQCGLNACLFTLRYFEVRSEPELVREQLHATAEGVLLSDLRNVLEGYDLVVQPRRGVTVAALQRALQPGTVAIIPIRVGERRHHYLVGVADRNGRPMLADVPYQVRPLAEALKDERLKATQGLVLFVRRPVGRRPPMADRVKVHPPRVDVGTFRISGPDVAQKPRRSATFEIENPTDAAVMVRRVESSCGCTIPEWRGGVIPAGRRQRVRLEIFRPAWGTGPQRRLVVLVFADGSERRVEVVGTGIPDEQALALGVSPKRLFVSVPRPLRRGAEFAVPRKVLVENCLPEELRVHSDVPWLSWRLEPAVRGATIAQPVLRWTDDVIARLRVLDNRLVVPSTFVKRRDGHEERVRAEIEMALEDVVRVEPALLRLSDRQSTGTVTIASSMPDLLTLTPVRVWSDADGPRLEMRRSDAGSVQVTVAFEEPPHRSLFVVHCLLKASDGVEQTTSFVVAYGRGGR
ncbi:MAG: DUF1573 domain-containing protein, partial [Planctomycetota bacterium]